MTAATKQNGPFANRKPQKIIKMNQINTCNASKSCLTEAMRISVDVDEGTLRDVIELTGEKRKSPALAKAITEYVHRAKAREFGRLIREGAFDYPDPMIMDEPPPDTLPRKEHFSKSPESHS